MDNIVLKEVLKMLGESGVRKLAAVLTGDHHNREVAKDFGLTLWQVRVCNQFLPQLCHFVLDEKTQSKKIPANVLYLKQSHN